MMNARYRGRSGTALAPSAGALLGGGHNLLMTDLGPLDVLGTIEGGRGYDELLPGAISIAVAGHPVKVLGLSMLAELKRGSASNKDKLTLLILEETLRRQT